MAHLGRIAVIYCTAEVIILLLVRTRGCHLEDLLPLVRIKAEVKEVPKLISKEPESSNVVFVAPLVKVALDSFPLLHVHKRICLLSNISLKAAAAQSQKNVLRGILRR